MSPRGWRWFLVLNTGKWLGVHKTFPGRENGNYEYHKAHQQQQQSILPSKWYDKNYVLFSILFATQLNENETNSKMTTVLIKILVESFAFRVQRQKCKCMLAMKKNETIADCIKLNNLKILSFLRWFNDILQKHNQDRYNCEGNAKSCAG